MNDTQAQIEELQRAVVSMFSNILSLTNAVLDLRQRVEELEASK